MSTAMAALSKMAPQAQPGRAMDIINETKKSGAAPPPPAPADDLLISKDTGMGMASPSAYVLAPKSKKNYAPAPPAAPKPPAAAAAAASPTSIANAPAPADAGAGAAATQLSANIDALLKEGGVEKKGTDDEKQDGDSKKDRKDKEGFVQRLQKGDPAWLLAMDENANGR